MKGSRRHTVRIIGAGVRLELFLFQHNLVQGKLRAVGHFAYSGS
jgi:hypothetical protein